MKTSLMVLAAFSLGTAAIAQDSTMQPGASAPAPATTPTTPDPSMPTNTPSAPQTDAAAPMPSDAAAAPAPSDASAAPAPAPMTASTAPQPATTDYPACSRTVTDKCVQKGGMGKMTARKSRRG